MPTEEKKPQAKKEESKGVKRNFLNPETGEVTEKVDPRKTS